MLVVPLGLCWIAAVGFAALDGRRQRIGWAAVAVLAIALAVASWLTWDVIHNGPRTMVAGDWDPGCLRSWLQDPDGDGTYSFTTNAIVTGAVYQPLSAGDDTDATMVGGDKSITNVAETTSLGSTPMLEEYARAFTVAVLETRNGEE